MNGKKFLTGMGMGLAVGGAAVFILKPGKRCLKSKVGKALHAMGEVADSVSKTMGW